VVVYAIKVLDKLILCYVTSVGVDCALMIYFNFNCYTTFTESVESFVIVNRSQWFACSKLKYLSPGSSYCNEESSRKLKHIVELLLRHLEGTADALLRVRD
jgi:hypothetical protein